VATPGYFRAIGIPLVSGRQLLSTDTPKSMPVAVISDAMARRYWPGGNAVGQRLKWGSVASKGPWLTIVGVIGNVKHFGLDEAAPDEVYMPLEQSSATSFTFAVRGAGDQSLRREEIRRLVRGMDAALPVAELFTTQELVERSVALPRFRTELLSIFALLAVLLATAGVYSVMASQVAQRRREIGIRLALGATPREVKRMVVTRGLRPVAVGCVLGLLAANALMRLAQEILFGVTPGHPRAYAVASALLCLTALIACYLPARRAASFDPIASIRAD
jgi:putative ABC transport system permease protein